MNIQDLLIKYTFHDSLIEYIKYENNTLVITIDFCLWMQDDYDNTQPETDLIKLIFPDVYRYDGPTDDIDSYSILKTTYNDGVLIISVLDDYNNKYLEIIIETDTVMIEKNQI
ncbi:hypothetical protein SAMN02910369_02619 [Lachnospiraceae bacterium NE2001]|nr:hypothetical protein SAMN02910369_02619 [Lachnospiraceae bacterium NE2001]